MICHHMYRNMFVYLFICRLCELRQSRFIPGSHSVNERFSDRNETTEGSTETIQKWQQAILSAFTLKWTWFENVFLVSWVWHWKSSNGCPTLNPLLLFLHSCLPFLHIFFLKNITKKRKSNMQNWGCAAKKFFQIVRLHVLDIDFFSYRFGAISIFCCVQIVHQRMLHNESQSLTALSSTVIISSRSWSCRFTCCVYTIDSNRILG